MIKYFNPSTEKEVLIQCLAAESSGDLERGEFRFGEFGLHHLSDGGSRGGVSGTSFGIVSLQERLGEEFLKRYANLSIEYEADVILETAKRGKRGRLMTMHYCNVNIHSELEGGKCDHKVYHRFRHQNRPPK